MAFRNRVHVVGLLAVLTASPGAVQAELGRDTHIQETGEVRIEVDRQVLEEFGHLFDLGYPPATVMMHAISTGMSINDILYIAVRSEPGRAQEFYDTAESLLPALPGWVCQAETDGERYTKIVDPSDIGDSPMIRELAQVYFNDDRRVIPFPNWPQGQVHMEASVTELAELVGEQRWYVPGEDDGTPRTAPNRPVFVSLYKHDSEIVVDSGLERIRRAQQQGVDTLPVVLVYNSSLNRPVTDFEPDVSVGELAEEFYGAGIELTAVPEWQVGDYHKTATIDELREVVDVPEREDILAERRDRLAQELQANGGQLEQPLLLTLVRSGGGRAWINDPVTVAVADELGIQSLPVVLFYHDLDRRPCGQPSDCQDRLCEAATAAGASEEVCSPRGETTAEAGTGRENALPAGIPMAWSVDPRLYGGLSYTQNQCTS